MELSLMQERRKMINVKDVPTEWWLRVIALLLTIIGSLGGYFGNRIINTIDKMQDTLIMLATNNAKDHAQVERNTSDIKDLSDKVYVIDGKLQNWRGNVK